MNKISEIKFSKFAYRFNKIKEYVSTKIEGTLIDLPIKVSICEK